MAQTSVRIYKNSGFNAVNIPDSPALLDSLQNFTDCYAIDINQERFLPQIRISAPGGWAAVKDVDYVRVDNFYYFVDNIWMSSGDVAELTLTPDFITSAGGPAALTILDGVTDRVHVTDDSFGLYGADDPYTAPALDMDMLTYVKDYSNASCTTFVETTLNLSEMGWKSDNDSVEALTAFDPTETPDPDTGELKQWVVFPVVDKLEAGTDYKASICGTTKDLVSVYGQGLYVLDNTAHGDQIKKGIGLARSLGIEESISGQFSIPNIFFNATVPDQAGNRKFVTEITGQSHNDFAVGVNFEYGIAVQNKRVYYGSYSPYFLTAGSGSTMSAKAEEIYTGSNAPQVYYCADPRRTGKPYFRFKKLNGIDVNDNHFDFFRGCVPGKEWLSHPMVFNGKSGSILEQMNYKNSRALSELDYRQTHDNLVNTSYGNVFAGTVGAVAQTAQGNIGGGVSSYYNMLWNLSENKRGFDQYKEKFNAQKAIEEQQLNISQNVFVPEVQFPIAPDLFAESTNNGWMVSRTVYKTADIRRIDKILTAYGYKYCKVLEASDFNNRTYFNYVSGSITVGNLPRWWADGIAAQIGTGVRVWHVKPSPTYYASNPVRVVTP